MMDFSILPSNKFNVNIPGVLEEDKKSMAQSALRELYNSPSFSALTPYQQREQMIPIIGKYDPESALGLKQANANESLALNKAQDEKEKNLINIYTELLTKTKDKTQQKALLDGAKNLIPENSPNRPFVDVLNFIDTDTKTFSLSGTGAQILKANPNIKGIDSNKLYTNLEIDDNNNIVNATTGKFESKDADVNGVNSSVLYSSDTGLYYDPNTKLPVKYIPKKTLSESETKLELPAIKNIAMNNILTGKMENLGNRSASDKKMIFNEIPGILASYGLNENDVPVIRSKYMAKDGSLKDILKRANNVEAFEQTALNNAQIVVDSMKKLPDTGSPLLNKYAREGLLKIFGVKDVQAFNTSAQVAVTEIARVLNSPTGAGVVSDSARKEIMNNLPENATKQQILAALNVLKRDMEGRRTSYRDKINEISQSMNLESIAREIKGNNTDQTNEPSQLQQQPNTQKSPSKFTILNVRRSN